MTKEERRRKCELRIQYLVDNLPDGDMPAMHPKAVEVTRSLIPLLVEIAEPFICPSRDGDVCLEFQVHGWDVTISIREDGEMNGYALLLKNTTIDDDYDTYDMAKMMFWLDCLRIS